MGISKPRFVADILEPVWFGQSKPIQTETISPEAVP